jgi:hypothetical protein
MEPEDNALDDFKSDFPTEESLNEANPDFLDPKPVEQAQQEDEGRPNREHRRTSKRLEAEKRALQEIREQSIAESAKLQVISEQKRFMEGLPTQTVDERLNSIFTQDDLGRKGAAALQSIVDDAVKRARAEALEDFHGNQREREQAVIRESEFIDTELAELEEDSGIDLTSTSPLGRKNRAEFLDMVEKFSSKDKDGDVTEYADFDEVFNVFKTTRKTGQNNTQNKSLASRGMARGSANTQVAGDKAVEAYLRSTGII